MFCCILYTQPSGAGCNIFCTLQTGIDRLHKVIFIGLFSIYWSCKGAIIYTCTLPLQPYLAKYTSDTVHSTTRLYLAPTFLIHRSILFPPFCFTLENGDTLYIMILVHRCNKYCTLDLCIHVQYFSLVLV